MSDTRVEERETWQVESDADGWLGVVTREAAQYYASRGYATGRIRRVTTRTETTYHDPEMVRRTAEPTPTEADR